MTSDPKRPGGRHRYSVPDHGLWREIARHVTPLQREQEKLADQAPAEPQFAPGGKRDEPASRSNRLVNSAASASRLPAPAREPTSPALTGIDRRMQRRLMRGAADIDARIDLHGHSIEAARARLQRFLVQARSQGHRLILVITGKGASPFTSHTLHGTSHFHSPERGGRLRRLVTEWLNEPEFRAHVSGFQPAHPRHGGGGALYVRLRRPKGHSA